MSNWLVFLKKPLVLDFIGGGIGLIAFATENDLISTMLSVLALTVIVLAIILHVKGKN